MAEYAFDAFISYSHRDMQWGKWLQRRLESFPIPKDAGGNTVGRHLRIFRDQTDLAGAELQTTLQKELTSSRYLLVICSPDSASSRWVNEEVQYFISLGRRSHILPFIVSGEPHSDDPALECFPPAMRETDGDELLGANIQEIGRQKAFLKTASILLNLRFNRLVDREKNRRRRNLLIASVMLVLVGSVTGFLLWRNAAITRKNEELSFDIYGAALVSFARKDTLEPDEFAFLQASAESGNVDAILLLADCYQKGWGTEISPELAYSWYLKAAEMGSTQGMMAVANCYLNAFGVPEDPEQVFYWNRLAAEAGDSSGMVNLASCYEDGYGVPADASLALSWYRKSAEAGNDLGMYQLARCYRSGIGMDPDPAMAFTWMKKLADTGNVDALYNVALMYQYAYGTEENPRLAYLYYREAAEKGSADAMRMTGWCIENHYGVDNLPLEWYLKAAEAGSTEAIEDIQRLLPEQTP